MQPHPGMCGSPIKMNHWLVPVELVCLRDLSTAAFPLLTLFLRILQWLLINSTAFLSTSTPLFPHLSAFKHCLSKAVPASLSFMVSVLVLCFSVTVLNTMTKSNLGGKDLFSLTNMLQWGVKGRQDRNSRQELAVETSRGTLLTGLLPGSCSTCQSIQFRFIC